MKLSQNVGSSWSAVLSASVDLEESPTTTDEDPTMSKDTQHVLENFSISCSQMVNMVQQAEKDKIDLHQQMLLMATRFKALEVIVCYCFS